MSLPSVAFHDKPLPPPPRSRFTARSIPLLVLTLASLFPIWAYRYLPTQDGGNHLYSAYVIGHYLSPGGALYRQCFMFYDRLVPNWTSHALLAGLMRLVSPILAEKLVASLYILGLPWMAWRLLERLRPGSGGAAVLVLPLTFNLPFLMGFTNFSLGLALSLWMIERWLAWRVRLSPGRILCLTGLGLLALFTHPASLALAAIVIGAMILADPMPMAANGPTRRSELLQMIVVLLPLAALVFASALFPMAAVKVNDRGLAMSPATGPDARVGVPAPPPIPSGQRLGVLVSLLHGRVETLAVNGLADSLLARVYFALLVILFVWTIGARARDASCPAQHRRWTALDRRRFPGRLGRCLHAGALPGLLHRRTVRPGFLFSAGALARAAADVQAQAHVMVLGAILLSLGLIVTTSRTFARLQPIYGDFVAAADAMPRPGLLLSRSTSGADADMRGYSRRVGVMGSASAYLSIRSGCVNLNDYEAWLRQFPLIFRSGADPATLMARRPQRLRQLRRSQHRRPDRLRAPVRPQSRRSRRRAAPGGLASALPTRLPVQRRLGGLVPARAVEQLATRNPVRRQQARARRRPLSRWNESKPEKGSGTFISRLYVMRGIKR